MFSSNSINKEGPESLFSDSATQQVTTALQSANGMDEVFELLATPELVPGQLQFEVKIDEAFANLCSLFDELYVSYTDTDSDGSESESPRAKCFDLPEGPGCSTGYDYPFVQDLNDFPPDNGGHFEQISSLSSVDYFGGMAGCNLISCPKDILTNVANDDHCGANAVAADTSNQRPLLGAFHGHQDLAYSPSSSALPSPPALPSDAPSDTHILSPHPAEHVIVSCGSDVCGGVRQPSESTGTLKRQYAPEPKKRRLPAITKDQDGVVPVVRLKRKRAPPGNKDHLRSPFENCPYIAPKPYALEYHVNIHLGLKPYICPYSKCGASFPAETNMKRHFLKHGAGSFREYMLANPSALAVPT